MIRAVVDTSILVRALLKPQGTVGPLLTRLRRGDYVLLYSEALLAELMDVLDRPRIRDRHHIAADDVRAVLTLLWLRGEPVRLTRTITACRDPQDDKVLEIAVAEGRRNRHRRRRPASAAPVRRHPHRRPGRVSLDAPAAAVNHASRFTRSPV